MIRQYCHDIDRSKALDCLKVHKDEPLFDTNCHMVIVNRMIEQNLDYRFNPALKEACNENIHQYCATVISNAKPNEELNGKVINCLKKKFREGHLTKSCENQMINVLHEQALNYKLNPLLQTVCKSEIHILCKQNNNEIDENGEVEECLKMAFLNQQIQSRECKFEVAIMIQEAKADIHVDPLLQRACTVDLLKYCSNVQSGNGRRMYTLTDLLLFDNILFITNFCVNSHLILELKCLEVILSDESKSLENDCKVKLQKRIEMFRNAAPVNILLCYM